MIIISNRMRVFRIKLNLCKIFRLNLRDKTLMKVKLILIVKESKSEIITKIVIGRKSEFVKIRFKTRLLKQCAAYKLKNNLESLAQNKTKKLAEI